MYNYIKEYFELKLYSVDDVQIFVNVKWINETEYKEITGIEYVA